MNAALGRLFWLKLRGGMRHRVRQLASKRGLMFLALVGGIIAMILRSDGTDAAGTFGLGIGAGGDDLKRLIDIYMPLSLLGAMLFTVLVSSGPAIYFSSNEINYLYTGPFSRRELVLYKIASYFSGAIVSAAIITLLVPSRASLGVAAFSGTLMMLLFMQLSSAAIRMAILTVEGGWFKRVRRLASGVIGAGGVALLVYLSFNRQVDLGGVIEAARYSPAGGIVLAPFAVFARIFTARQVFPDLAMWLGAGLAMNTALLFAVIGLDGRTSDRALSENRRLNERWLRVKQGGSFWASEMTQTASLRQAPHLGGAGPVLWRQAINARRNYGRVVLVFLGLAALTGPILEVAGVSVASSSAVGGIYFLVAFMMPRSLVCDFRGEISRIETYKALPVAPWRICVAQLVVPVMLSSAILLVMIASTLAYLDFTTQVVMLTLAGFVLPFSLLLYGLENLVFLVFPAKLVPVGRVDFDFLGRTLVDFVGKTLVIFMALGFARALGIMVQKANDGSQVALVATAWLVLAGIGLATVPAMALAFRRFDLREAAD